MAGPAPGGPVQLSHSEGGLASGLGPSAGTGLPAKWLAPGTPRGDTWVSGATGGCSLPERHPLNTRSLQVLPLAARRKAAQFPGQAAGWPWAGARPVSTEHRPLSSPGAEMQQQSDVVKRGVEAWPELHADGALCWEPWSARARVVGATGSAGLKPCCGAPRKPRLLSLRVALCQMGTVTISHAQD